MERTALENAASGTAGPARQRALTFGLCMAVVAIAFEAISVATAMPAAARQLNGLNLYAWVFSVFLIGQLFATVAAGGLFGRIRGAGPMIGGVLWFAGGGEGLGPAGRDGAGGGGRAPPGGGGGGGGGWEGAVIS